MNIINILIYEFVFINNKLYFAFILLLINSLGLLEFKKYANKNNLDYKDLFSQEKYNLILTIFFVNIYNIMQFTMLKKKLISKDLKSKLDKKKDEMNKLVYTFNLNYI